LGSNLQNPIEQIRFALAALRDLPRSRFVASSPLYRSIPLGPVDQPDYVNAVAAVDTELPPHTLLRELHALERNQGRVRTGVRWGARTIDLDLLLYGDFECQSAELTLPHPGMCQRNFVLYPLSEIAPELRLPDGRALCSLLRDCAAEGLLRIETSLETRADRT
jgi:2-amino-4-hydroxy-6-hydroxymethyldihydropteridine diphosphokinase